MSEAIVLLHRLGKTVELRVALRPSDSSFGGHLGLAVKGFELEQPLHTIAYLGSSALHATGLGSFTIGIPLVHGMRYDGSHMHYRFDATTVFVEDISPRYASESWPYADYPAVFPLHHLEVGCVTAESLPSFADRAFGLPDLQLTDLVAVVPTPRNLGFSLWGQHADPALVFECSLSDGRIFTYNVYD